MRAFVQDEASHVEAFFISTPGVGRQLIKIIMKYLKHSQEIENMDAEEVFMRLRGLSKRNFLLESKSISHVYGRMSLIGVDPVMEIRGKDNEFEIKVLNERGSEYLGAFSYGDFKICDSFESGEGVMSGVIERERGKNFEEGKRTKQKNIAQIIRLFLDKFKVDEKEFIGLYGAFSYDFIRLFEDLPRILPDNGVHDFRLLLCDTFVLFDHLKERAEVISYGMGSAGGPKEMCGKVADLIKNGGHELGKYAITNEGFEMKKADYEKLVDKARDLAKRGELFEVVYSNTLQADFRGDPFALYMKYSEVNPSPYLFYFDFEDEQLVGASPEMMVRCENGRVSLRPISGTARRGADPIEDHENMLDLLKCEKERAELDMLIDLGRNDVARICKPGVKITDYRFVEKYSKVMHTVAHVTGDLRDEFCAFDSLIACLNAGTLTGAPKVAAMAEIEKAEVSRRGYYGGTIGYLTFSGNMDTGIIIRTAHIRDNRLKLRVGATLLYDSEPEKEYQETLNKAEAFMKTFGKDAVGSSFLKINP